MEGECSSFPFVTGIFFIITFCTLFIVASLFLVSFRSCSLFIVASLFSVNFHSQVLSYNNLFNCLITSTNIHICDLLILPFWIVSMEVNSMAVLSLVPLSYLNSSKSWSWALYPRLWLSLLHELADRNRFLKKPTFPSIRAWFTKVLPPLEDITVRITSS